MQFKRLLLFATVILFCSVFMSCGNNEVSANFPEEEYGDFFSSGDIPAKLNVAITPGSPDYYLKNYHVEGFYFEIINKFAEQHDIFINYIPCINVQEAMTLIREGKCDIACIDNIMDPQRKKNIRFTIPILKQRLVLVQNKKGDSLIKSPLQFNNDTLFYSDNPTLTGYLEKLSNDLNGRFVAVKVDSIGEIGLVKRLNDGEIKYAVISNRYASALKQVFRNLDFGTLMSWQYNCYWMFNSKNKFLASGLNQWIDNFIHSSSFKNKKNKYNNNSNYVYSLNRLLNGNGSLSQYDAIVKQYAEATGINPYFILALMYHESMFYPNLTSPKGAYGLLQLMPQTLEKYGITTSSSSESQIIAGIKYIKELRNSYAKNVKNESDLYCFTLAAYNAGIGRVDEARRLAKKKGFKSNLWWDNSELGMRYIRRHDLIQNDSTSEEYKGHHTYYFVRNVMETYNHFKNLSGK